jgi:uncharacterized membrane protein
MIGKFLNRIWASVSVVGLLLGTLFFVASLTPTLVPRTFITQGVLSGVSFAAGYGIGLLMRWLWTYLELPRAPDRARRPAKLIVAILCLAAAVTVLWRTAGWQNSIRALMQLEPVPTAHPLEVCLIAIATFGLLLALALLFGAVFRLGSRIARRFVPRRVSYVIGLVFAVILFWSVANGVIFRFALHALDASFAAQDALIEPESTEPADPLKAGSAASLIRWNEMGRTGREFVSMGPTAAAIGTFTGRAALEPVRVYVGLGAAETAEQRAALALEELKRVRGFDRSVLIVITPTGSGWIDPAAMDSVEYLHGGDVASVALQYSYLSSPLSLIVEPDYGEDAARALFEAIYRHWTSLPKDQRPKLYLHGLSLGSLNSEKSLQLFEILGDPINGALWSGPPFENRLWRSITDQRNSQSPAWLPEFRDGSYVRFMNQNGTTVPADRPWGPMRVVYLQYASDAVTFFDYRNFWREPEWMKGRRGPDVSPELRWYPVVTMLQLALDMAVATTTPIGFGHVFAPEHYVDAWIAVSDVRGWSDDEIARLKLHLAAEQRRAVEDPEGSAYDDRGG